MTERVAVTNVTEVLLRRLPELAPSVRENEAVFGDPLHPHALAAMVVKRKK